MYSRKYEHETGYYVFDIHHVRKTLEQMAPKGYTYFNYYYGIDCSNVVINYKSESIGQVHIEHGRHLCCMVWIPRICRSSDRYLTKVSKLFMDYMLFILYRDTFGPVFVGMIASKQSWLQLLNVDVFRLLKSHFY